MLAYCYYFLLTLLLRHDLGTVKVAYTYCHMFSHPPER